MALLALISGGGGGSGTGGLNLAMIEQGGTLGGGSSPGGVIMYGIVPSGVATVTLEFPATRRLRALAATGKVVANVFVMRLPTLFARGGWPTTTVWRAADGHVVKTIDERPFHP